MEEAPAAKSPENESLITNYTLDNINYEIKLSSYENNLLIEIKNKSEVENSIYIFYDSFDKIIKLDKYFLLFENIGELQTNIIDILNTKENYEIRTEKEKELKLILKPTIGTKIKNIEISLTKKEIKGDNLINILFDKVNFLEKENQLLKDKLNEFQDLFKEEVQKRRKQKNFLEKYKDILVGENISTIQKIEDYELIKNGIYEQVTELNNTN